MLLRGDHRGTLLRQARLFTFVSRMLSYLVDEIREKNVAYWSTDIDAAMDAREVPGDCPRMGYLGKAR